MSSLQKSQIERKAAEDPLGIHRKVRTLRMSNQLEYHLD